jgi:pilus assembly protein Flp/PilA
MLARIATRIQVARTCRTDEGATAVEYGLLVALIAVFIIAAVTLVGTRLDLLFRNVAGNL